MKILVTFYSRTGSTGYVANKIAKVLEADLFQVVETKNRNGKLIYLTGGYEALREKLTDIKVLKSIQDYDMIVIGSPVWARKFTPAIRTFLVKNDFSNKMVALFATSKGDNPNSFTNIKKIIQGKLKFEDLEIKNPLDNKKEANEKINDWCIKLKQI